MDDSETEFFSRIGIHCLRTIGKGGFGVVFEVYSDNFKLNFALKKVPEARFNLEELECLKQLDVPNVVQLYQYYHLDGFVYLLMEYCPNDLEKKFIHQNDMHPEQKFKYILDCCMTVKAIHERNIAHCDIKPANFLIDSYDRVKLADFGMSSHSSENNTCCYAKGTKLMMAPEIFFSNQYNPMKADIWALGVTIYYLTTHEYPFYSNDMDVLKQKIACACFSSKKIDNKLLVHVIERCLDRNPDTRATIFEIISLPYFTQNNQIEGQSSLLKVASRPVIVKPKPQQRMSINDITRINRSSIALIPTRNHFRRCASQFSDITL